MYGSAHAAVFIKFLAPFFHHVIIFNIRYNRCLQAMNLARAAMINSLIGAIVKIIIIFMLATKENFGIMGAAIGIAVGTVLVTFLHFSTDIKSGPNFPSSSELYLTLNDYDGFRVQWVLRLSMNGLIISH